MMMDTEDKQQKKEIVAVVIEIKTTMTATKKKQPREGARCHNRMTCDSQHKKGDNKGEIRGGRRTWNSDDSHQG